MSRWRLGVALLVPEPVATEVDGLRRALGDGALGRIPAHLTLVPPVNVREDQVARASAVVRDAAAAVSGPLDLELGPAVTFAPVTPVVYLEVGGALDQLGALRDRVFREPLRRRLTHDFVPHVTLCEELPPERITAALAALSSYRRAVSFDRLALLQEGPGHRWSPISLAPVGPVGVVGRGGLPVELTVTPGPDVTVAERVGAPESFAVTARRQGEAVGLAECRRHPDDPAVFHLVGLAVSPGERATGVGSHLLATACSRAAELGATTVACVLPGTALDGFLRHRGFSRRRDGGLERLL